MIQVLWLVMVVYWVGTCVAVVAQNAPGVCLFQLKVEPRKVGGLVLAREGVFLKYF